MNQVLGPPIISKQALWILTLGTIPWVNLWSQIHFFGMKVVIYGYIERREVPRIRINIQMVFTVCQVLV